MYTLAAFKKSPGKDAPPSLSIVFFWDKNYLSMTKYPNLVLPTHKVIYPEGRTVLILMYNKSLGVI